ncbi:MAG: hypothetical protein EOM50_21920 [Erysipelotrichia bacterium]|nr:hypothetical protein [Erysipelotrichia bacterium]
MKRIIDQFTQSLFTTYKKDRKETSEKRDKIKEQVNIQKSLLNAFMVMDISTEEGRQAAIQVIKSMKKSIHTMNELLD